MVRLLRHPLALILIGFFLILILGAAAYGYQITQTPPPQPIEFPHSVHVGLGIQCLYCHPGPYRQAAAGLPTQSKCWGCHGNLAKYEDVPVDEWPEQLQLLEEYVRTGTPIEWVPVAMVPDFVHFNHRPHLAAGFNCENCHGELGEMTVYENPRVFNMGWCLRCHRAHTEEGSEKFVKLNDCGTCHY
jgi:hypothetical protein